MTSHVDIIYFVGSAWESTANCHCSHKFNPCHSCSNGWPLSTCLHYLANKTNEVLTHDGLSLFHCPFCNYSFQYLEDISRCSLVQYRHHHKQDTHFNPNTTGISSQVPNTKTTFQLKLPVLAPATLSVGTDKPNCERE